MSNQDRRSTIESLSDFEKSPSKMIHTHLNEEVKFSITNGVLSPFLSPLFTLEQLNIEYSFRKRIFKYIEKNPPAQKLFNHKEPSVFQLRELQRKYKNEKKIEKLSPISPKKI